MPSIITHHILAQELYNRLDKNTQNKISNELDIYNIFAQSHDLLFYHSNKEIKELGHFAHKHNTQDYLINIVKNIKKLHLENNQQCVAYLYGSITHYVFDSTAHPFIFYKTGTYEKDDPNTYKYKKEHTHMEKDIDAIYYEKYYRKPFHYCNISKNIIKNPIFNHELNNLINQTFIDTYQKENISLYFQQGIKKAKLLSTFIINDKIGFKRAIFKAIEKLSFNKIKYLSSYSTHITKPNLNFLNLEKKEWTNPANKDLKYNYSFNELYEISINKSIKIINEVNKVLYNNQDLNTLKKVIPDISYTNGLLIKDYKKMQYFEY